MQLKKYGLSFHRLFLNEELVGLALSQYIDLVMFIFERDHCLKQSFVRLF
jgi:hypothetical protein